MRYIHEETGLIIESNEDRAVPYFEVTTNLNHGKYSRYFKNIRDLELYLLGVMDTQDKSNG